MTVTRFEILSRVFNEVTGPPPGPRPDGRDGGRSYPARRVPEAEAEALVKGCSNTGRVSWACFPWEKLSARSQLNANTRRGNHWNVGDSLREVWRCMDDVVGFVKPSVPGDLHERLRRIHGEFAAGADPAQRTGSRSRNPGSPDRARRGPSATPAPARQGPGRPGRPGGRGKSSIFKHKPSFNTLET